MNVLSRPYDAFPNVVSHVEAFLQSTGLAALPGTSYLVYGSTVRALWTREAAADINIAFVGPSARETRAAFASPARALRVRAAPYATATDALAEADFTICQAVFHDGSVHFSEHFFEHVAQRLLVVNRIETETALSSLLRTYKFAQRGYAVTQAALVEILSRLPREVAPLPMEELVGQSAGVVL